MFIYLDELSTLHCSGSVEANVNLYIGLLISQFDNWHLKIETVG